MSTIEALVQELPPELQQEVEDFTLFLLERHVRKPFRKPELNWRGALKDLRDQYTSVELQHKVLEWWGD